MAGNKKKKKPAANAARGFATTSIASKPRVESTEGADPTGGKGKDGAVLPSKGAAQQETAAAATGDTAADSPSNSAQKTLSPEEFERQLEESELQILVDKHAQKIRRDAQRQMNRLETDRRLLRGQAESVNSKKWIPADLMEQILDLIQSESRFSGSNVPSESAPGGRLLPEEDLTMKLWTLQQTLISAGFSESKVQSVLNYVLHISTQIGAPGKDSIWGMEEALEWLARESSLDELPDYNKRHGSGGKGPASGMAHEALTYYVVDP